MPKRGALKQLTSDNWEEEEEPEEAGQYKKADPEVLKTRAIRTAKRRNPGMKDPASNPFAAFSGFTATSTSTTPGAFAFLKEQPAATPSTGKSEPNGVKTVPAVNFMEKVNSSPSSKIDNSTPPMSSTVSETPKDSKKRRRDPEFYQELYALNDSVVKWIREVVERHPCGILSPIFKDYDRYIEELTAKYPSTEESKKEDTKGVLVTKEVQTSGLTTSLQDNSDIKIGSTSSDSTATKTVPTTGLFSKEAKKAEGTFSFGVESNTNAPSSGFKFGTSKPIITMEEKNSEGLSIFGGASNTKLSDSGLKSGTNNTEGSKEVKKNDGLFTFGATSSNTSNSLGFKFDTNKTGKSNAPASIFGNSSASSGFSFGLSSGSKPFTFGFQSTTNVSNAAENTETSEKDSEEPPKNDFTQVKETDAVYEKRCKVFAKTENEFKERGVGTLYVKVVSEKVQLFVRADTNLGNIILNTILTSSMPLQKMGKNNVMLVCVPNPQTDKEAVPVLIRVKSSEDADELLKKLKELQTDH